MKSVRLTLIVTVKALTVIIMTTVTAVTISVEIQHLHYIQQWVIVMKSSMNLI